MATKKKIKPPNTSNDPTTAFAWEVVNRKRIAGPFVRASCARHLRDLENGHERGLSWNLEKANKVINFFPDVLKLNGGEFEGLPFELLSWEKFVAGSIHGWMGSDGFRRFRAAYVETAKGSGKSPLAAGLGMFGLVADDEPRAEIYSAATKKDQAMILFRDAVAMRDLSDPLKARLTKSGTGEKVWNLAYAEKGSWFRPISSDDAQSGPRPHIGLIDELHEHKTDIVVDMMRAGTKSRRQALIFMITNAGSNKRGPCWNYHEYGRKVATGEVQDDAFFSFICALDEGDDPFRDEKCWSKANPSLEEADLPGKKYIRELVTQARGMPSKEAIVKRLNFCQWTEAESPWLSSEVWRTAERVYDWHDYRGRRAVAGLDLSSTTDLTALVLLIEPVKPLEPWKIVPFCWLPEIDLDRKADTDRVPYLQWKAEGLLETTPGRAISKRVILQRLSGLCDFFEIIGCGYDRWRIEDLLSLANDEGITLPPMIPIGQGYKDFSPAIETFEELLLNNDLVHPGHKVLDWCIANSVIEQDGAENRKLSKDKAVGRIDLSVAAVMAASLTKGLVPSGDMDRFTSNVIMVGL